VSPTPQSTTQVCTHERRPGTTVCLHCRHAERIAAGERRKKLLLRGSALGIVLVIVGVTAAMSATAIRGRLISRSDSNKAVQSVSSAAAGDTATPKSASVPTVAAPAAVAQQGELPAIMPAIASGETMLRDSVMATRTDSNVVVSFDRPMTRTRRPEKFEAFLRSTLPQIYGAPADSALSRMPEGAIASQGNLLMELPTRGIRIPLSNTATLVVYPETRPGQDGPLVIRYRSSVTSASDQR